MKTPEQDAAALEEARQQIEAAMQRALPIIGTQHFKAWVAGIELGALMRWTKALPPHG